MATGSQTLLEGKSEGEATVQLERCPMLTFVSAAVGSCPTGWACTGAANIAEVQNSRAHSLFVQGSGSAASSHFLLPHNAVALRFNSSSDAVVHVHNASSGKVICSVSRNATFLPLCVLDGNGGIDHVFIRILAVSTTNTGSVEGLDWVDAAGNVIHDSLRACNEQDVSVYEALGYSPSSAPPSAPPFPAMPFGTAPFLPGLITVRAYQSRNHSAQLDTLPGTNVSIPWLVHTPSQCISFGSSTEAFVLATCNPVTSELSSTLFADRNCTVPIWNSRDGMGIALLMGTYPIRSGQLFQTTPSFVLQYVCGPPIESDAVDGHTASRTHSFEGPALDVVASREFVYALGADFVVRQHASSGSGGWSVVAACCMSHITLAGDTLYGVGQDQLVYRHGFSVSQNWSAVSGCCVTQVTTDGMWLYGIGHDKKVYHRNQTTAASAGGWSLLAECCVTKIVIVGSYIYGIDVYQVVVRHTINGAGGWLPLPDLQSLRVLDVAAAGMHLYALTAHGDIYQRVVGSTSWSLHASGDFQRLAAAESGVFAVSSNFSVHRYSLAQAIPVGRWYDEMLACPMQAGPNGQELFDVGLTSLLACQEACMSSTRCWTSEPRPMILYEPSGSCSLYLSSVRPGTLNCKHAPPFCSSCSGQQHCWNVLARDGHCVDEPHICDHCAQYSHCLSGPQPSPGPITETPVLVSASECAQPGNVWAFLADQSSAFLRHPSTALVHVSDEPVTVTHLVARLVTGVTWTTPVPLTMGADGFSVAFTLEHVLNLEGAEGSVYATVRFSDNSFRSVGPEELIVESLDDSLDVIPPNGMNQLWKGRVAFGATSHCVEDVAEARWIVCGQTAASGMIPARFDMPPAIAMNVNVDVARLAPPDNPASRAPISVPTSGSLSIQLEFQGVAQLVDFTLDSRTNLTVVEHVCASLADGILFVLAGARCHEITVFVNVVGDSYNFSHVLKVPIVRLDRLVLSFTAWPPSNVNNLVPKLILSRVRCTEVFHHARAWVEAWLSDGDRHDVSDQCQYSSNLTSSLTVDLTEPRRMRASAAGTPYVSATFVAATFLCVSASNRALSPPNKLRAF